MSKQEKDLLTVVVREERDPYPGMSRFRAHIAVNSKIFGIGDTEEEAISDLKITLRFHFMKRLDEASVKIRDIDLKEVFSDLIANEVMSS